MPVLYSTVQDTGTGRLIIGVDSINCLTDACTYKKKATDTNILQTYRSLQGAIIDANSNTVKVSHFQVGNLPFLSSLTPQIPKNRATAYYIHWTT